MCSHCTCETLVGAARNHHINSIQLYAYGHLEAGSIEAELLTYACVAKHIPSQEMQFVISRILLAHEIFSRRQWRRYDHGESRTSSTHVKHTPARLSSSETHRTQIWKAIFDRDPGSAHVGLISLRYATVYVLNLTASCRHTLLAVISNAMMQGFSRARACRSVCDVASCSIPSTSDSDSNRVINIPQAPRETPYDQLQLASRSNKTGQLKGSSQPHCAALDARLSKSNSLSFAYDSELGLRCSTERALALAV